MKACLMAAAAALLATGAFAEGSFLLHSSSFSDGERLSMKHAGKCLGDNVSPALSWTNLPEGTRSIALVVYDPEGRRGLGVPHMVAYGIHPDEKFAEGELSAPSPRFVSGRNHGGGDAYAGPCPPAGTADHHYIFTAIATDLAPDALAPGLNRDQLFAALDGGHAKAAASLIGLSRRP